MKTGLQGTRFLVLATAVAASACSPLSPDDLCDGRQAVVPEGWLVSPSSSFHSYGLDCAAVHGGAASAFLSGSSSTTDSIVALQQWVRADSFRGKRVRWSGWVQARNIVSQGQFPAGGALWMRVDGYKQGLAFDNMIGSGRGLRGTTPGLGWGQAEIVLDVPSNAMVIFVGALLHGSGELMIDDLRLEAVGVNYTTGFAISSVRDSASVAAQYLQARPEPVNLDFEGLR